MDWATLVENFYSNFQKYQIGIIFDEDELKDWKEKIINFRNEKVIEIKEDAETIEKYNNDENTSYCVPLLKQEILYAIDNRIELIDKKIKFLEECKSSNASYSEGLKTEKLEKQCLNFITNNINELNDFLTNSPIDLNKIKIKGKSLLQFILDNGKDYWKFIKTLFDFGLNCNSTIENNTKLFFIALNYKYFEVAEFLLTCEIAINKKDVVIEMTPIMAAFALLSSKENIASDIIAYKRIIYLLCNYKDIKIDSPSHGPSALFYSQKMKDEKLTKLLQSKGAKIVTNNLNDTKIKSLSKNDIKSINNFKVPTVAGAVLGIIAAVTVSNFFSL